MTSFAGPGQVSEAAFPPPPHPPIPPPTEQGRWTHTDVGALPAPSRQESSRERGAQIEPTPRLVSISGLRHASHKE